MRTKLEIFERNLDRMRKLKPLYKKGDFLGSLNGEDIFLGKNCYLLYDDLCSVPFRALNKMQAEIRIFLSRQPSCRPETKQDVFQRNQKEMLKRVKVRLA